MAMRKVSYRVDLSAVCTENWLRLYGWGAGGGGVGGTIQRARSLKIYLCNKNIH